MEIHHLVHGSNYSRDLSAPSDVQGMTSLNTTNSLDQVSSRKTADTNVSSSTQYQLNNVNDEFPQFSFSGDNNKISLVANLDNKVTSSSISSPSQSQASSLLPTLSNSNSLSPVPDLLLTNADLWSQFYRVNNEMIITKAGRCIFPLLKFRPVNLDPTVNYSFIIDFVQVSKNRYRFKKGSWISIGPDKRKFLSIYSACGTVHGNPFTHPDSPQSGKIRNLKVRKDIKYIKYRIIYLAFS
jgi:hypothetical protein